MPNRAWYINRADLRIIPVPLFGFTRPILEIVNGTLNVARVRDLPGGTPYNLTLPLILPLNRIVAVAIETIYDSGRQTNEAMEIRLNFAVPPYLHTPIAVRANVQAGAVDLPQIGGGAPRDGFPVFRVKPDPATELVDGEPFYVFRRNNAVPPVGGVRCIAWAQDVSRIIVPEMVG